VWISHKDVNGIDFWRDGGPLAGQIVHQMRREGLQYQARARIGDAALEFLEAAGEFKDSTTSSRA